jgi:hypothetical protein
MQYNNYVHNLLHDLIRSIHVEEITIICINVAHHQPINMTKSCTVEIAVIVIYNILFSAVLRHVHILFYMSPIQSVLKSKKSLSQVRGNLQ